MNVKRIITAAVFLLLLTGCTADSAESSQSTQTALSSTQIAVTTAATTCTTESTAEPVQTTIFPALVSPDDINLRNAEGDPSHYLFTYHETDFQAVYKTDHWTIQDSYRITDPDELLETGIYDCLDGDGVCLIEWASLIESILPPGCIQVTITPDLEKGFDYRRIEIEEERI